MAYRPKHDYRSKDALERGDPDKKVMGRELSEDFEAISADLRNIRQEIESEGGGGAGGDIQIDVDANTEAIKDINLEIDGIKVDVEANAESIKDINLEIDGVKEDIEELEDSIVWTQGEVDPNTGLGGEIKPKRNNEVQAQAFAGDGSKLTGIMLDQLADVNADPKTNTRDDLLIWNGTNWVADDFAFIDTALRFKGGIAPTANAPATPESGDLYVFDADGTLNASWGALSGTRVAAGKFVGYVAGTSNRWYLLGNMADAGVMKVSSGTGIKVDDSKPSEPVVSIDRTEVDTWYAAKIDSGTKEGETLVWSTADAEWKASDHLIVKEGGTIVEKYFSLSNGAKVAISNGNFAFTDFYAGSTDNTSDDGVFAFYGGRAHNQGAGIILYGDDHKLKPDEISFVNNGYKECARIEANGNATFLNTVTADKFVGDGSGLTGIGGGGGGGGAVDSVNGKTGVVVLSASDVGAEPAFSKNTAFNKSFGTTNGTVAQGDHTHSQYLTSFTETDPTVPTHVKGITQADIDKWNAGGSSSGGGGGAVDSVNGETGVVVLSASDVGAEPAFTKNSAFNKNFGTTNTTVAKGNHTHSQYLTSYTETDPTVPAHVKSISQADIDKWNAAGSGSGGGGKTYTGDNGVNVNNTTDKISMSGSYTGDLSVSASVSAPKFTGTYFYRELGCGVAFSYGQAVLPANGSGSSVDEEIDFGQYDKRWKDAWFSERVNAGEFHAKPASKGGTGHHFYAENDMTVSAGGSTGRDIRIDFLGTSERFYFQDWAAVLKIAGSYSGPEMHSGIQACISWNSDSLGANPKGNVKSLTKLGTGHVRGTYNTAVNPFVGSSPVVNSSTNMGNSNVYGYCSAKGGGSQTTFEAFRLSATGSAVEASGNCVIGMPITEAASLSRTKKTDIDFERRKAEHIEKLMHRASNTEWYDADSEGYANSPFSWAVPNMKTGGVLLTRSLVADQDSQEFYPRHQLINVADWPVENCLFDAWELSGKRLIVNPDKARRQVLDTLKYQAKFYLPRVQCLQGIFEDEDQVQELKDLILSFKSRAEVKTVTTLELNEIMRLIRQDIDEDYAFAKF